MNAYYVRMYVSVSVCRNVCTHVCICTCIQMEVDKVWGRCHSYKFTFILIYICLIRGLYAFAYVHVKWMSICLFCTCISGKARQNFRSLSNRSLEHNSGALLSFVRQNFHTSICVCVCYSVCVHILYFSICVCIYLELYRALETVVSVVSLIVLFLHTKI